MKRSFKYNGVSEKKNRISKKKNRKKGAKEMV